MAVSAATRAFVARALRGAGRRRRPGDDGRPRLYRDGRDLRHRHRRRAHLPQGRRAARRGARRRRRRAVRLRPQDGVTARMGYWSLPDAASTTPRPPAPGRGASSRPPPDALARDRAATSDCNASPGAGGGRAYVLGQFIAFAIEQLHPHLLRHRPGRRRRRALRRPHPWTPRRGRRGAARLVPVLLRSASRSSTTSCIHVFFGELAASLHRLGEQPVPGRGRLRQPRLRRRRLPRLPRRLADAASPRSSARRCSSGAPPSGTSST